MQVNKREIDKLQKVVDELSGFAEERIRCSERLKQAMATLNEGGCTTIEEATDKLTDLDAKISKKEDKLHSDFEEFRSKFEGVLNAD